jgi:hypothetical protein
MENVKRLEGTPRHEIAASNNLSAGAVTNFVNEWRRGLGLHIADGLRDLSISGKSISLPLCVLWASEQQWS